MKVLIKKGKHAGKEGFIVESDKKEAKIKIEEPGLPAEYITLAWDGFQIISALVKFIKIIVSLFKKNKS